MQNPSLKDILLKDAANAQSPEFKNEVLVPGTYSAKILGFTEEDTYQYVTVEINKKKFNKSGILQISIRKWKKRNVVKMN